MADTLTAGIDPNRRYATGEAARLLGVTRSTLVARIKAGVIKATQLGRLGQGTPHRRVLGSELLRALGLTGQPAPAPPPPPPKRRSNKAVRDELRAMRELGLDK